MNIFWILCKILPQQLRWGLSLRRITSNTKINKMSMKRMIAILLNTTGEKKGREGHKEPVMIPTWHAEVHIIFP